MSDLAIKVSEPIALKAQLNEDWLAVVIGLLVFALALASVGGTDLLGWAVTTSVYTDVTQALTPFAKAFAWLRGGGALLSPGRSWARASTCRSRALPSQAAPAPVRRARPPSGFLHAWTSAPPLRHG